MAEIRRGAVVLLQAGDPEIAQALAAGMMEGRAAKTGTGDDLFRHGCAVQPSPEGEGMGRLSEDQRAAVEAEIDRQAIEAYLNGANRPNVNRSLLRVAVGNHKTAEDYAQMRFDAEVAYGEPVDFPTPMRRALDGALAIYAMFVEAVSVAYHAQDKVLGG